MPIIKSMIPESYMLAYEKYMRLKTGAPQCGIMHNQYIDSGDQEGYKNLIAAETHMMTEAVFGVNRDKRPDDVVIIEYTNAILDKRGNLVDWRVIESARKRTNDPDNQKSVASVIWAIMCSENEAKAYNDAADVFGYQFALLAYLFFVKNHHDHLPISPDNFDRCFGMIGSEYIDCPKLSRNGSWNTYSAFIKCVQDVRQQLTARYPDESVTLLDAHSVLWTMGEKQFIDFYRNTKAALPHDVRAKETEVCAKARIGQGEYRKQMLELWGGKCSVTGCAFAQVLTASHAKPWSVCSALECRDQFNGLILIPNLDRLFDGGFISFEDNGKIIISSKVGAEARRLLGINAMMRLRFVKPEHLPYLKYHREKIFID